MREAFNEWWRHYGSLLWGGAEPDAGTLPPTAVETLAVTVVLWALGLVAALFVGLPTVSALRGLGVMVPAPADGPLLAAAYAAYGLALLAVGTWLLVIGRRLLAPGRTPEQVAAGAGRVAGVAFLATLTVGGAVTLYQSRTDPLAWLALGSAVIGFGVMTVRVARGREIDGSEPPGPLPATFQQPPRLLDPEPPPPTMRHATVAPPRRFAAPAQAPRRAPEHTGPGPVDGDQPRA